jgi:hypothetical protein
MRFVVLRRADRRTEAGQVPPALEPGVFLTPSRGGARLLRSGGVWRREEGPFPLKETIAGITVIEAASREDALDQVLHWPPIHGGADYEIRVAGRPDGGVGADGCATAAGGAPRRDAQLQRFVVLVRSDRDAEADLAPPAEVAAAMDHYDEAAVRAGVLLAGDGLRTSAWGARVQYAGAGLSVVDGPFSEVRELIAGYWMVQTASRQDAVEWAQRHPFPGRDELVLEIRAVCEPPPQQGFTPDWRDAAERMFASAPR